MNTFRFDQWCHRRSRLGADHQDRLLARVIYENREYEGDPAYF
ncbi:MAG: hypothetical protein ACRD8U_00615 [Pyrinomonadaceae bacterium]